MSDWSKLESSSTSGLLNVAHGEVSDFDGLKFLEDLVLIQGAELVDFSGVDQEVLKLGVELPGARRVLGVAVRLEDVA